MATQEEILIRVAGDASGLDSSLTKSEGRLESFAHKGHDSFVHVERPARAFHHLLGEISSRAPLLAEGLESLINPTTGAIALVAAAFGFAMEKMKDFNKRMDEVSASNAKAIEGNREALADLAREQKDFQKSLAIDPVTGVTKAVGEEKDPNTRLSQARQNRERFAAERNARLEEIKRLRDEERRLAILPAQIKGREELLDAIKKSPADYRLLESYSLTGTGAPAENFNLERRSILENQIAAMRAQLGTPDRLREISERRRQLESEVRERSKAIGELQDIIDPLAPHDALPRGRRGGSFRISGPGGTFSGTVGNDAQEIKSYLKAIAESPWVKDGKIQVPNGK